MMNVFVKKPIILCMAFVLVFTMLSGLAMASNGTKVTFNPNTGNVDFVYGSVTLASGSGSALTGIRHLTQANLWNDSTAPSLTVKKGHTTIGQTWGSGQSLAELETTVAAKDDGTLTVSQNADTQAPGIKSVQWGLIVPDTNDLIIPVLGGIRLTADSPDAAYGFQQFDYPNIWEAQMLLIQGEEAGCLYMRTMTPVISRACT